MCGFYPPAWVQGLTSAGAHRGPTGWKTMVGGKETDELSSADAARQMADLVAPLADEEIEKLTIRAIREHRESIEKAEAAFHAWQAASATEKAAELHDQYEKLMLASRAQQMVVATLIERLGYIPNVPES